MSETRTIWCNTHRRPAHLCATRGGIMLPCQPIDLTDILEIEYIEDEPKITTVGEDKSVGKEMLLQALKKHPPRLPSKSMDKLNSLIQLAETFIVMQGHKEFETIEISLTWDHIRPDDPQSGLEAVVVPLIQLKLSKTKMREAGCRPRSVLHEKILELIGERAFVTAKELIRLTGAERKDVYNILGYLNRFKRIRRINYGKYTRT